jgi:DNA gyrase subunit B
MTQQYWANEIKVLEGLEPVRHRPGMYIGSTDTRGLHHMVYEIVDNAVDEAMAGFCHNVTVILDAGSKITVHDDGRGIPVEPHPKTGRSTLETVLTVLHAGGKFEKSVYKVSGGLHGVGSSVVNALSSYLEATIHRDGKMHRQTYMRGVPTSELEVVGETTVTGTTISFIPDDTIFDTIKFEYETLATRLKHAAYLTPWVCFTLVDNTKQKSERWYYEWGIKSWLNNIVDTQRPLSHLQYLQAEGNNVLVEIAFQFVDTTNDQLLSFVNNISTKDGGTHVLWFKTWLLNVINEVAKEKNQIDKKIGEYQMSDVTEWLYAIVSVKVPEPQFEGQTKGRLGNSYVRAEVEKIITAYLQQLYKEQEDVFAPLIEKIQLSAKARIAAKLARETVMRKGAFAGGVLPGKLADCSRKNSGGTELYIVEGNSAWWSAKQARDSKFQAILPLRGKVLNTEQAAIQKVLANNEVKSLILALGCGMKESYDETKLRYDRIVVMTDADVDGAHIRTLLLTFFFRYMRPLIEQEHLYIAMSPLYKLNQGKKEQYIYPMEYDTLDEAITGTWFDREKVSVQRYKGLGEMNPEQLRETTMDPTKRKMLRVNIEDAEEADKLFRILMGEDVLSRKHFILANAKNVKDLDV